MSRPGLRCPMCNCWESVEERPGGGHLAVTMFHTECGCTRDSTPTFEVCAVDGVAWRCEKHSRACGGVPEKPHEKHWCLGCGRETDEEWSRAKREQRFRDAIEKAILKGYGGVAALVPNLMIDDVVEAAQVWRKAHGIMER